MLILSHQDIAIGKKRIQISCILNGMSGNKTYEVGDRLQGELKITPYGHLNIERIEAKLEFIVQSQSESVEIAAGKAIISSKIKLSSLKPSVFSFNFSDQLSRINQCSICPKTFWRLTFIISTPVPIKSSSNIIKPSANTFIGTFKIPVTLGKGNYFAKPRKLPVERFTSKETTVVLLMSFMPLASLFFVIGGRANFFSFLLVAISLPLVVLQLLKLSRFRNNPMQLVQNNQQKIKFRTLYRGEKSLRKVTIGYRVVAEDFSVQPKNRKHTYHTFYQKELLLDDDAKRFEHFIDLTLPWPDKRLPTSYRSGRHGYTWEFFIKTPGIFREREQAWPVQVGWKPFQLPKESASEEVVDEEMKETLNLHPLKEEFRLKNGKED